MKQNFCSSKRGKRDKRGRKSIPFGVTLGVLLLASTLEITGCFGNQPSNVTDAKATTTTKGTDMATDKGTGNDTGNKTTPPAQTATPSDQTVTNQTTPTSPNAAGFVLTGTFLLPNFDALNYGKALVTQIGTNTYHLVVSTAIGFSHHVGNIESDFTFDGNRFVLTDAQYSHVTLSFTDHSITIDYPGYGFGGANAEPKGTYYLSNSADDNGAFLSKLYDLLHVDDSLRHGDLEVNTYLIAPDQKNWQELLLVRGKDTNSSLAVPNSVVVYDPTTQTLNVLGDIDETKLKDLRSKMEALKVDQSIIYKVLHKNYSDRFIQLQMDKFDNGTHDLTHFSLTDAEAFYIVTGQKGVTKISSNKRNAQNIGSIFITEVDHSDDKTVLIHEYENVRNSETDVHNATHDWYEVNRVTGEVKSTLYES